MSAPTRASRTEASKARFAEARARRGKLLVEHAAPSLEGAWAEVREASEDLEQGEAAPEVSLPDDGGRQVGRHEALLDQLRGREPGERRRSSRRSTARRISG